MRRFSLLLRGLWWRRGLTSAVLAVAIVTTTAAALGPLYARAAGESTLHDHLTSAGSAAGLHFQTAVASTEYDSVDDAISEAPLPGSVRGYPTDIQGLVTAKGVTASTAPKGTDTAATRVAWRQGDCAHLVIVAGRCPSAPGEALVSARTGATGVYDWTVGKTLTVGGLQYQYVNGSTGQPGAGPAKLQIVGTYRPKNTADPYWFGRNYFDAHASSSGPDEVDTVFVDQSAFDAASDADGIEVDVDFPLDVNAIRLSDLAGLRHAVGQLRLQYGPNSSMAMTTGLDDVLSAAAHERRLLDTGTTLVILQLALLAWLVLFQVISDAIEARGNEIAMAKLRGHSPASTIRFGLGEPVALLAAALPIGLLVAWLLTHVFAASVLVPGVPVLLNWSAVVAALAAFAGGLLAAVLAGHRTLTRSVLDQWRHTAHGPRRAWLTIVVDVLLAAAACAGLVALRMNHKAGSHNDTAALLAPGLLVFAVALLGVRLLPVACRALSRSTRSSRRVGLFLAGRQVARRPIGLRLAALLAVAVGLATFAVAGETVASHNRAARAQSEVGAARVASIQYDAKHDPVEAVRKADPAGAWAMAAATWLPDGGAWVAGTVLAVDSSRLAAVAYPATGGPSVATVAATINASPAPPITLTGKQLRVHVTASDMSAVGPTVQIDLRTPDQPFLSVDAGTLRPGSHDYVAALPCPQGCTFQGITWNHTYEAGLVYGTALVTGIEQGDGRSWTPVDARLTQAGAWRSELAQGEASDKPQPTALGLRDDYRSDEGGYGGLSYAYTPSPLPCVATRAAIANGTAATPPPQMSDLTGTVATFTVQQWAPVLPYVLDDGVMFDLTFVRAQLPAFDNEATWQVWLGPHAPPDAVARLGAAGLTVQSVQSAQGRVAQLARQGPALALLLLLTCAIAGAVLAVGGTAISVAAGSRRRSYEIAALRAVGVPAGSLRRASVFEQMLLLGSGVALGVPTGVVAALLAMPVIPEFSDSTPIAMRYVPQALPTVLFVCAFVVLLLLTAVVAASVLIRLAVPARLREAEG